MSWERLFTAQLQRAAAEADASLAPIRHVDLFSPEYRALTPPKLAVRDALRLDELIQAGGERFDLWEPHPRHGDTHYRLRLYGERERSLDEIMPFLANLGLRVIDQVSFRMDVGIKPLFLRSFAVMPAPPGVADLMPHKTPLLESLHAMLGGWVENDALNGLLLVAGLAWRQIDVFRAYRNYYFQLGSRFSRFRFHRALLDNPNAAALLFRYFASRFEPDGRWSRAEQREEEALFPVRLELAAALDAVADTNEDRILRGLFNLIDATLRTDFYQPKPPENHALALKIGSLGVIDMPAPRPLFEIYVHAAWMEGIHLRGAKVARGGIRWSDRPDDFRSEILSLMRTQMTKNALIVPLGAKGGFVLNTASGDPETQNRLAWRAYATLIRGLLNLTDNRVGAAIEPPPNLVTYDDADPYLVVAADKGTARLSDSANGIAAEYGFWLGDAFASGGSHGYDHKQLGITARGAWECVKRHFREAGQDIETQPFTVVGIGSMDGDVFGNGMLLSQNIRLRAAFGSQHIFLDPTPDPAISYQERRRLYDLPRSGWNDYDPRLISPGGGVFRRDAKNISLTSEVRDWLCVRHATVDGEELIRRLLTAPVDLLWLGGIGTYVKATEEAHEDAADKLNDLARVDAVQLRAKVVGEGANLGFTQKARVEYALADGRINTDAVDNSGGVDLSDHEVNLKILMALLERRGAIAGEAERNRELSALTGDVISAVLANNYEQSLCLSLDQARCLREVEPFLDVADRLVNAGLLDRAVESFPTRKDVLTRGSLGFARPELAVLMAYAKLALKRALLDAGDFLAQPWTAAILAEYFPTPLRARFGIHLSAHPLAREITATLICNAIIGQAGAGFLAWVDELEPAQLVRAVGAYLLFDQVIGGRALRHKVCALDGRIEANRQYALLLRLENLLAEGCRWTLQAGRALVSDESAMEAWRSGLDAYLAYLSHQAESRTDHDRSLAELAGLDFTPDEARRLVFADRLGDFPALADAAALTGRPLAEVARLSDAVARQLGLPRVLALLGAVQPRDRWERRTRAALLERFLSAPLALTLALSRRGVDDPAALFSSPEIQPKLARLQRLESELTETAATSLIPFAALSAALEALREACGGPFR
ncbi:NAD-glutamate dehydrogenase domain-containing protein [Methylomagnum sp.]